MFPKIQNRLHDGDDGYLVITPLERSHHVDGYPGNTTVLVCRGWIPKDKADKKSRPDGLPTGEVIVEGLLREPWKKNMFTPANKPEENAWYFPDVYQMAEHTGTQAVWIEETMKPDLLQSYDRASRGVPIGRPPEVNLRNSMSSRNRRPQCSLCDHRLLTSCLQITRSTFSLGSRCHSRLLLCYGWLSRSQSQAAEDV